MRSVRCVLGLMVVVVAVLTVLQATHTSARVAGTNLLGQGGFIATVPGGDARLCQVGEPLPAGARSMQLLLGAGGGPTPDLDVRITQDGRTLARAHKDAGWAQGVVELPISTPALREGASDVRVCLRKRGPSALSVAGEATTPPATVRGRPQLGKAGITYFARPSSLAGELGTILQRYGRGTVSWFGPWTMIVLALAAVGSLACAVLALLTAARERRDGPQRGRRIPRAVRLCAAAAGLVGLSFALLTPPMQVPDEQANVAYTMFLAHGQLPIEDASTPYPDQLRVLLDGLGHAAIKGRPYNKPPWTEAGEAGVRYAEQRPYTEADTANASSASGNPPLFYALGAVPYALTPGSLLDKLMTMRLLAVLLGIVTVLAVGLLLRDVLPRSPALAAAGTLAVAFQPKFAFMSGGFNGDALLFAASAVTLLAMTRLLRHGLSRRRGVLLGVGLLCGVLAKPLFLAMIPPALVALAVATWRDRRTWRRRLSDVAVVLAIAFVPVVVYSVLAGALADHPYFPRGTTVSALSGNGTVTVRPSWWDQFSYAWQLYLPRFPPLMTTDFFPASTTLRDIWSAGFIGAFGWTDYSFSPAVQIWAFRLLLAVGVLAVFALVVHRDRWRGRRVEFAVYAFTVLCVAGIIAVQDYRAMQISAGSAFRQARYLLPLLALYGGLVAVAARLFGRRVGELAGIVLVGIASTHLLASLLLTVGRYYA